MENNSQQKHSEMTASKVEFLKNKLLTKEGDLIEMIQDRRREALEEYGREATGGLSDYPQHIADMGTDEFAREFDFILLRRQQQELEEVRDALSRIEAGTYGICEKSGREISLRRLEAMPEARFDITVTEREELRARPEAPLQS